MAYQCIEWQGMVQMLVRYAAIGYTEYVRIQNQKKSPGRPSIAKPDQVPYPKIKICPSQAESCRQGKLCLSPLARRSIFACTPEIRIQRMTKTGYRFFVRRCRFESLKTFSSKFTHKGPRTRNFRSVWQKVCTRGFVHLEGIAAQKSKKKCRQR